VRGEEFKGGIIRDIDLTYGALHDVADWLGFDDTVQYARALEREREHIFDRVKEPNPA